MIRDLTRRWLRLPLGLRTAIIVPCWAGLVYGALPFSLLGLGRLAGLPELPPRPFHLLGLIPFVPGAAVALTCVTLFHVLGRGTPSPYDPPERLLIVGPYAYCRNPMVAGNFVGVLGEGILLQASLLLLLIVPGFVLFHLYIVRYEERHLVQRFGEAYEEYRRHVPQWVPRVRPYRPTG